MLYNYLKTAIRNLRRHRFFSFINIFGLAVSLTIGMGVIMLVADQMMYDRYNTKRDRIYRVNSVPRSNGDDSWTETATTTLPLKQELLENYSGVEKTVRLMRGFGNNWLEIDQDVNIPVSGYYADPEVLDFFEYELEYGNPATALLEPHSVVLTKKAAKKLFKQDNPLGEMMKVGENGLFKVTGVIRESTHKSHIAFDALASLSTVTTFGQEHSAKRALDYWYNYNNGWVYVLLEKGKKESDIQPYLTAIEKKYFSKLTNPDVQQKVKYKLQKLTDITPGPFVSNPIGPFLPWMFVYFFAGLAAIVLLTSCFNFTNLSIARSLTRAREIGIRKVTGAMRWQIFIQFLSESVIVALLSLGLAVLIIYLVKPLMLELSFARMMKWDLEVNPNVYLMFVLFAVVTGVLAGFFPAVVVSGFQPIKVLKNLTNLKLFSAMGLRKALLVAQFTFSLIFILTVIIVFSQLRMYMNADHGFSMDHKVIIALSGAPPEALKNELLKLSKVESVSAVSHIPAAGTSYGTGYKKSLDEKEWTEVNYFSVDEDYLKNMDVSLLAGKFFSPENAASNKNFIVLGENAVHTFHFASPADAVGQVLIHKDDSTSRQIIGVVKNYNHQLLMEPVEPMLLVYNPEEFHELQVKYTGSFGQISNDIETSWTKINPGLKVDYKDFSEEIHKIYDIFFGDLVNILGVIATLAILISCLGLLGMATYTTETRRKEISIRKVLGSTNGSLIYLLSKGFVGILLVAILLAVPAAYLLNNLWLEKLTYHVSVSIPMILLAVALLICFGVVTIGSQTWRAVFVKPVDNLKGD